MPATQSHELVCPACGAGLNAGGDAYRCQAEAGHSFPVVNGIPRFVPAENYAASFGLQWNTFRRTQLDSVTGLPLSKDRLERILGFPLSALAGKRVLEAGCGAGRFTELLVKSGAKVVAADISSAVEANWENCRGLGDYTIIQADIRKLPVAAGSFDAVICVGVIQHTPDPEETIRALAGYVKPGGQLFIDHYSEVYPATPSRQALRKVLTRVEPKTAMRACELLTDVLWPIHRTLWVHQKKKGFTRAYYRLIKLSPLVDYQTSYPGMDGKLLRDFALLDTHDTLTDHFKHLRSLEQVQAALAAAGMADVEAWRGGNGVEARARKPAR